jgi:hypothetical protein
MDVYLPFVFWRRFFAEGGRFAVSLLGLIGLGDLVGSSRPLSFVSCGCLFM